MFNQVFPTHTVFLTSCLVHCGADRDTDVYSYHDYIACVCLPGHVLVKLWLSERYIGDIGHTLQTDTEWSLRSNPTGSGGMVHRLQR